MNSSWIDIVFQSEAEALEKNPSDPNADLFSILGNLESFRREDGTFLLKIVYPELRGNNKWEQKSNPATEENIDGFREIHLGLTKNENDICDTYQLLQASYL